ncbi:TPA: hypothetical protein ACG3RE_003911 [Clostridioides difficile]|nr:hypothetical protein [Clostridioides difficile]HBF0844876.1 hypothetical protein [Clostridioides difficile]HBG5345924.1 hypothetical protein [Clostridioides difficile]
MNFWNGVFLLLGIILIIGNVIKDLTKHKFNYLRDRYLNKLELKYGSIDREKTIKLEIFYQYLLGLEYIIMGLLIRRLDTAIISVILVSIVTIISYYLIRKKYITL